MVFKKEDYKPQVDNSYNPTTPKITVPVARPSSSQKLYQRSQEVQFLIDNPDFEEMPATIEEFLGPGYLDIDRSQNQSLPEGVGIRDGVKAALLEIFGTQVNPQTISIAREALFTGGIGIGKSTLAAIALIYCVHWVQCLYKPQAYFGLLPGSRIAFMLMSTKDTQAKEVLFGDIKEFIARSQWFQDNCKPNNDAEGKRRTNQLRFPKNVWIIPGNSLETAFEGYNILAGIIDEGDSHKVTEDKDYAEAGFDTISSRIASRFPDRNGNSHRGLLMVIGQMKKTEGFMARKKAQLLKRKEQTQDAVVVQMTIWESMGWDTYIDKKTGAIPCFYYDISRRQNVPEKAAIAVQNPSIIKIPMKYFTQFENDPVKALRDLAGIPPAVEDPFIALTDRIDEAQEKWKVRYADLQCPVSSSPNQPVFDPDFEATDRLKRAIHVDIAYAAHGDALGMAMGHIPEMVEVDGELQPLIVFDMLLRIKPSGGQKLMLSDFRQIIYDLRDERRFNISVVTFDGFNSQDSIQIMRQKKFNTAESSVDRNKGPYEDLRQAIYERRIEFPEYLTYLNKGDTSKVNIAKKELMELTDTGRKIDHPPKNGSKDLTDAMAGVTYALMGNSTFRRGSRKANRERRGDVDMGGFGSVDDILNHATAQPLPPELSEFLVNDREKRTERDHHGIMVPSPGYGLPPIEKNPFGLMPEHRG